MRCMAYFVVTHCVNLFILITEVHRKISLIGIKTRSAKFYKSNLIINVICGSRVQNKPEAAVAVHCVAGLGRAPVMVAIALIELGMKYEEAVETIRE